jgi:hypothetical protein
MWHLIWPSCHGSSAKAPPASVPALLPTLHAFGLPQENANMLKGQLEQQSKAVDTIVSNMRTLEAKLAGARGQEYPILILCLMGGMQAGGIGQGAGIKWRTAGLCEVHARWARF